MKNIFLFFEKRKKLTLLLAVLWTVVIIVGCSMPGRELPKLGLFDHFDKVVHFVFFMGFFILWYLAFSHNKKMAFLIIAIAVSLGFAIEFYQMYCVAGRSFDVWDGVADSAGALCGYWLLKWKKMI